MFIKAEGALIPDLFEELSKKYHDCLENELIKAAIKINKHTPNISSSFEADDGLKIPNTTYALSINKLDHVDAAAKILIKDYIAHLIPRHTISFRKPLTISEIDDKIIISFRAGEYEAK